MDANPTPRSSPSPGITSDRSRPWLWGVGTAAGVVLGLVFLVAAYGKALDPAAFAEQIGTEGLDFLLPATAVAIIALALEAGLGTALVLGLRRLWVLLPTAGLVLFFLFLTGRNYYLTANGLRSPDESCGCFGSLVERTPSEAFWQDLLLLGVPLILAFLGRRAAGRAIGPRAAVAGLAAVAGGVFGWLSPSLSIDDLATRLSPGAEIAGLCAGTGEERTCLDAVVPELASGEHLVVMAELESAELTGSVERLNEYALAAMSDADKPRLWVLNPDPPEAQRPFFWKWGPVFDVREAPPALLAPLYRRLPRSFAVEDGTVTRTWTGLPPPALDSAATPAADPPTDPAVDETALSADRGTPLAYLSPA